jgi:hypothetical protein
MVGDDFDKETNELERELMATQKTRREDLEVHQTKELEEFHRRWASIGKRKKYEHPSSELTVLRKQLAFLRAHGRYKDADEVSAQIDELATSEEAENTATMQEDCADALVKLQERHGQEREAFESEATEERQRLSRHRQLTRKFLEHRGQGTKPTDDVPPGEDEFWTFTAVGSEVHRSQGSAHYPMGGRGATAIVVPVKHHPRQGSARNRRSQPLPGRLED